MLHALCCGEEAGLMCAAVAAGAGSSSVFCNGWLFLSVHVLYAFLESVVADRIGMAA